MVKRILILSSFLLLAGCASADETSSEETDLAIEESEDTTIDSQSVVLSEDMQNDDDDESEETDENDQIEPLRTWEEFDDLEEFREESKNREMFNVADAKVIENEIEKAFEEEVIPDTHYILTSQWSVILMSFISQMEDHYSEDYIDKLHEVNWAIIYTHDDTPIEEVQGLVREAREIRESE